MNKRNPVYATGQQKQRKQLSRRQFIGLMGFLGAGTGTFCGGMTTALVTLSQISASPPTATPQTVRLATRQTITPPPIVDRASWGAISPDINARNERGYYNRVTNPEGWYVYPDDLHNMYQTLVIHHSGFYDITGKRTLAEVQRGHREDKGWADVGYHFMVDKDGTIYEGRDVAVRGVHVEGFNTGSLGLCLFGDFRFEAPSQAQLDAVYALSHWLVHRLQLTHLAGHSEFNSWTECPGLFLNNLLGDIASGTGLIHGTNGYVPRAEAYHSDGCTCFSHL